MNLARTNRKLVEQLRYSLDIEATQAALDRGQITPIQARNIVKWIVTVKDIRENPIYWLQDETGSLIGGDCRTRRMGIMARTSLW